MLDLVIRGARIVDGTGAPSFTGDVGVRDGRIVAVGPFDQGGVDEPAARTIDADGLTVAPGVIDIHTHYDVQALWDPALTPSPLHGVTTVIGGNCGFSIAPLEPEHVGYVMEMMARVEGMPLASLEAGPAWDWRSFGEWLDRLDGHLAVNAGFHVGHSTMRRVVMGDDATHAPADADQIAAMVRILHESLSAGALGFSSSLGDAHTDGDGAPVPSRAAQVRRVPGPRRAVRDHAGTSLEFIPGMGEISDARIELMTEMSLAADRPLNWNLLGSASPTPVFEQQLTSCDHAGRARRQGGRARAPRRDASPQQSDAPGMPGWGEVIALPDAERRRALSDPAVRDRMRAGLDTAREPGPRRHDAVGAGRAARRPERRRRRRRARHRPDRRAPRRRRRRRPAPHHDLPVAGADHGRLGGELAGPGRGLAGRARRARRLRRRRARRRHVPRQLPVGRAR